MKVRVAIIESEAGWGQRIDEIKTFGSMKVAEAFVEKYNKPNAEDWKKNGKVPNWYMKAEILS